MVMARNYMLGKHAEGKEEDSILILMLAIKNAKRKIPKSDEHGRKMLEFASDALEKAAVEGTTSSLALRTVLAVVQAKVTKWVPLNDDILQSALSHVVGESAQLEEQLETLSLEALQTIHDRVTIYGHMVRSLVENINDLKVEDPEKCKKFLYGLMQLLKNLWTRIHAKL